MKNRFRFRAWDKVNKKMIYPDWVYGESTGDNTFTIMMLIADFMHGVVDELV